MFHLLSNTPISNSQDSSVIDMDNIEILQLPSDVGQLTSDLDLQPPPPPSTDILTTYLNVYTQYLNDGDDTFERIWGRENQENYNCDNCFCSSSVRVFTFLFCFVFVCFGFGFVIRIIL